MRTALAIALAACGRIAFDPIGDDVVDAGDDADPFQDASTVCGAVPFNDGFDDGVRGSAWFAAADPGITVAEVNGRLEIALVGTPTSYGSYRSTCTSDHRNRAASVRLAGLPLAVSGVEMVMMISRDAQNTIGMQYQNDRIEAFMRVAGNYTNLRNVVYDPVGHRYFRVGANTVDVIYEVSADGVAWNEITRQPMPFDLSASSYNLNAGAFMAVTDPGTAAFDSFAVR